MPASFPLSSTTSTFDRPKSSTFNRSSPPGQRGQWNRLAGLRSRWMMPEARASASGLGGLKQEVGRLDEGDAAPLAEQLGERLAGEVLHHQKRRAVFERADVEHARHVLAGDRGGRPRLAEEALGRARLGRRLGTQHLLIATRWRSSSCCAARKRRRPCRPDPMTDSTRYLPASTSPGAGVGRSWTGSDMVPNARIAEEQNRQHPALDPRHLGRCSTARPCQVACSSNELDPLATCRSERAR